MMRASLLPGLLDVLAYNLRRQQQDLKFFEMGRVFLKKQQGIVEQECLAAVACGKSLAFSWHEQKNVDFYTLKGVVENLFALGKHTALSFSRENLPPYLHPGRAARICQHGKQVGVVGELHPQLVETLDLPLAPYVFEIALEALRQDKLPKARVPSKFPSIRRDLAILVDREVQAGDVLASVKEAAGSVLVEVVMFDVYAGEELPAKKKSLAFAMTLQSHERTLLDEEVQQVTEKVKAALNTRFAAEIRA